MAMRAKRDMTLEEFEAWAAARRNVEDTNEACAEEGGPRVSLVPQPTSVPLDILPDEVLMPGAAEPAHGPTAAEAVPFTPEPSRKFCGGWSADRQRLFIESLAETGSVHLAARSAGLSARSAYGLRVRSVPFAGNESKSGAESANSFVSRLNSSSRKSSYAAVRFGSRIVN